MSSNLCDATTSSGRSCKNRSVGEAGGRQYCRVESHKTQVEGIAPPTDPAPAAAEETPAPAAEAAMKNSGPNTEEAASAAAETGDEVVEEAPAAPVEPDPFDLDAFTGTGCPWCAQVGNLRWLGLKEAGTTVMCRHCLHRWDAA